MAARFLFNSQLWDELDDRIPKAKKVRGAVAYLGTGGSRLLPLRKGDELVVDMSVRAVRSGVTNPSEVQNLLRRGVKVFSRETLHAKFVVIDGVVIAGSSNISNHAKTTLDEAAVLTDDAAAVHRANATLDALCTEPVRKEYLARCLKEYRPPAFGAVAGGKRRTKRLRTAKVWLIGGLVYSDIPDAEESKASAIARRIKKRRDYEKTEVTYSHYLRPMKLFSELRVGDWLVVCIRDGRSFDVYPPAQFLGVESYSRGRGKRRYLLLRETPADQSYVRWTQVRKLLVGKVAGGLPVRPRTTPLKRDADGDALLSLWNERGKWKAKRG